MALEAVVCQQGLFCYNTSKELYNSASIGAGWSFNEFDHWFNGEDGDIMNQGLSCFSMPQDFNGCNEALAKNKSEAPTESTRRRRKRGRTMTYKNEEAVESQRMTHIAVERNRRRLMNEYLAVLRSLMPASYAQRGDQASIVGGAINYVKELEQLLQTLESQKQINNTSAQSSPFASFFAFPQYSSTTSSPVNKEEIPTARYKQEREVDADIEATMIESYASLKVRLRQRPKQLLRLLMGLQSLWLTILHLNVTSSSDQMVLYSFSLKVENDCQLTSVDEIAAAVHQIVESIYTN